MDINDFIPKKPEPNPIIQKDADGQKYDAIAAITSSIMTIVTIPERPIQYFIVLALCVAAGLRGLIQSAQVQRSVTERT